MEKLTREKFLTEQEELNEALRALKKQYIKDCAKYPEGTKLRLTDYVGKKAIITDAIVYDLIITSAGIIKPALKKLNKDGIAHATAKAYIWSDTKVEKL